MSKNVSESVLVLWDESHIWGLLVWRAMKALGVPVVLAGAKDIPAFLEQRPRLLLVPGGWARRKAEHLGTEGLAAVRRYVTGGGAYLGFCGGAGLALTDGGLDLCPWTRKGFTDRMQHFVSGHMRVRLAAEHCKLVPEGLSASPLLPVWWPARFNPAPDPAVMILATYETPGPDLMVADIPLSSLPGEILDDWQNMYGVRLWPHFMAGQPCVVEARMGRGRAVLSYAHLETPASAEANLWLVHLLSELGGLEIEGAHVPAWDLEGLPVRWDDSALAEASEQLSDIVRLGQEHFLLFWRNPWLLGWRRGIPGAGISSLYALVRQIRACEPTDKALDFWRTHTTDFAGTMRLFYQGLSGYLLAERLAMTLASAPDAVCLTGLKQQRAALFGPPPGSGGLYGKMLPVLEKLARLTLPRE